MKTFEITATISESLLGDVPDGTRIDLQYSRGKIAFVDENRGKTTSHLGVLIAGNDWALVRADAVCIFDGTANATINGEIPLILSVEGRADLLQVKLPDGSRPGSEAEAVALWRAGFEKGTELPVVVSVSVTIDKKAPQDLRDLFRAVFWGHGKYVFKASQVVDLELKGVAAIDAILQETSNTTAISSTDHGQTVPVIQATVDRRLSPDPHAGGAP